MKKHWLALLLTLSAWCSHGQSPYPHSLCAGIRNSIATVTSHSLTTAGVSLDLNHQRNISKFFSFRTSLVADYFFPVRYQRIYPPINSTQEVIVTQISYSRLALVTGPGLYHRDENFNLFIGFSGGIGMQSENYKTYQSDLSGNLDRQLGRSDGTYFQLGTKPFLGISFSPYNDKRKELEFSLFQETWWTIEDGFEDRSSVFGMVVAYRYNFREG